MHKCCLKFFRADYANNFFKGWDLAMTEPVSRHDSDKRVIRTKKAIKEALFRLMEEKDISSISISELTQEANINRRTFYTHYSSITDILEEIESDLVEALGVLVQSIDFNAPRKGAKDLFLGLHSLITFLSRDISIPRISMRTR